MMKACEVSELACQEFYTWVNAESGSFAKLQVKGTPPGKPTKHIYDAMMGMIPQLGRPRRAA
jgi:hypothetical protein